MNPPPVLAGHHQLCDELHQLTLDENQFLRRHQLPPGAEHHARKRALLDRLDASLGLLRELPAASARDPDSRALLEKARSRILQILQLDRENEQLLLRCSLAGAHAAPPAASTASASMLQKIYARSA